MSSINQVLVISPEADHHQKISGAVERCGLGSIYCKEFVEARSLLARQKFRVVFCHDTLPDGDFRGVIAAERIVWSAIDRQNLQHRTNAQAKASLVGAA